MTVAVARRAKSVEYALPGAAQVVWFLECLAREWREAMPPGYGPWPGPAREF